MKENLGVKSDIALQGLIQPLQSYRLQYLW